MSIQETEKDNHSPFFCFPCGKFFKDIDQHTSLKAHKRNYRKWQKEMDEVYNV